MGLTKITSRILDSSGVTILGTIATGVWQGTAINQTYLVGQSGTNTGDETLARINALDVTELGTISSGVWQGSVIAEAYLQNQSGTNTGDQTTISGNAGTVTNGVYTTGNQTIAGVKTFSSAATFSGNVGIGVAAHGTASLNITNSDQHIRLNNGSELGIITLDSDGKLDIWAHGAGETIDFRTGAGSGTVAMSVVGTDVGIGTDDPKSLLNLESGNLTISKIAIGSNTEVGSIDFRNNHMSPNYLWAQIKAENGSSHDYSEITFSTSAGYRTMSEKMRLNSSGNLGIGTTSPDAKLEVEGEALFGSGTDGIKISYSGGNSTGIIDTGYTSTGLEFRVANSEKMRITSDGTLELKGNNSASTTTRQKILFDDSDTTVAANQLAGGLDFSSSDNSNVGVGVKSSIGTYYTGTGAYTEMRFATAGSDGNNIKRLNISSGGNVDVTSSYLRVMGNASANTAGVGVELSYNTASNRAQVGVYDRTNNAYKQLYFYASDYVFDVGGTPKLTISSGGLATFSNGIQFGTGATLNDYEEGSWTPTISHNNGSDPITITIAHATYVRVGKIVHVKAYLTNVNPNGNQGGSGAYYAIRSLPFNMGPYNTWEVVYATSSMVSYGGYCSGDNLYFMHNAGGQNSAVHVNGSQLNAWGSNIHFMFSCTYTMI